MRCIPNPGVFQSEVAFSDKRWTKEEIEAIYGVHHVYSQKKSKVCFHADPHARMSNLLVQDDIEHQKKADYIVATVLKRLDKDGDGTITLDELEAVGLEGLPNFDELGAEGHHYDVESGA